MNVRQEVSLKLQQVMQVWCKLSTFWKAANCSPAWKLQVYDAIIQNKLLYGLENVHLTQAVQRKINAFQLKGLRRILGLQTTFVNRSNTNEFVLRRATEISGKQIKLFSDLLWAKRAKFVGHILRTSDDDPLRQVTYEPNSANAFPISRRRVGGPRQQWRQYTHRYIWNQFGGQNEFEDSPEQNRRIQQLALSRVFKAVVACGPTDALAPLAGKKI